jgi:N-acetylglucosamine-6-phosphate deacetylase
LSAATITPAETIGEPSLGRLEPGAVADLVWWDENLHPKRVWTAGQMVYDAETADYEAPAVALPTH